MILVSFINTADVTDYFYAFRDARLNATVEATTTSVYPSDCATLCMMETLYRCLAFNYDTSNEACELFSVNPISSQ